jgi:hypothetical protein
MCFKIKTGVKCGPNGGQAVCLQQSSYNSAPQQKKRDIVLAKRIAKGSPDGGLFVYGCSSGTGSLISVPKEDLALMSLCLGPC